MALIGCVPMGSVQTAETLGKGGFQLGVEPGAWGAATDGGAAFAPAFNLAARFGVSPRVDLGFRLGLAGTAFQSKFLLTDPDGSGVRLALAPQLGGFFLGVSGAGAGYVDATIPLLIGIPVGESELTLGPRVHDYLLFAAADGEAVAGNVLLAGTSVGFAGRVSENFRLLPELTIEYPIVGSAGASGGGVVSGALGGSLVFAFHLGFLIDLG